ncbi:hypothetical protein [uncultured Desulfobacter sp.]|uniref:hypothetical protein n=1 Tax=uncultured Desulfobacter sp. TaxID=240139 RepID=UPI002AAA62C2|nr:hypothetical protein [uncultured Desulfobacter sp.]
MNTNKHEYTKKVVVSILEHTTQNSLHRLKTEPLNILNYPLSDILRISRLKNISVHLCLSVVPNLFPVSSVYSVVKIEGIV